MIKQMEGSTLVTFTDVPSVIPLFGRAIEITKVPGNSAQYLEWENSLPNFKADVTVQLWLKLSDPLGFGSRTLFDNRDDNETTGLGIFASDPVVGDGIHTRAPNGMAGCSGAGCVAAPFGNRPTDSEWHFIRVVRSVGDSELRICIDGEVVASAPMDPNFDFTSSFPPGWGGPCASTRMLSLG